MLVVTTDQIHGWDVQRVCGEVFGLSLRVPAEPGAVGEKSLTESRAEVIARMLEQARSKGGNAVVGLRFDTTDHGGGATELCAYGTAIVAIPMDEGARQTATALGYGQPSGGPQESPSTVPEPEQQYAQQYPQQQAYDPNRQYQPQQPQQPQPDPQQYPQNPGYQQYPPQGNRAK